MSKRWLSGVLIFALGFGCPSLVTNATAQEPPSDRGELEEGLGYISTERAITLVNRGKYVYLIMVQHGPGTTLAELPPPYNEGILSLSGFNVSQAIAYRLEPVAILSDDFWRPCMGADCTWIGPLPPPPPPIAPPGTSAVFLAPQ